MGSIGSEMTIYDGVTSVMSKIEDSVVSTITAYEQAGAAADQMAASAEAAADHTAASAGAADQAAATTGAAIDQMSASVGALADYTDYWTEAVGNYDTSALRAIHTTQELIDMGYMSAEALQAEAEAAQAAADAQAAAAEAARSGTQEQQKLTQAVQTAATDAYQKATSVLTEYNSASDLCADRIKDVERQLFKQTQKLAAARALYDQLIESSGAATNEAERQRGVVEKLTDVTEASRTQFEGLRQEMDELTVSEQNAATQHEELRQEMEELANSEQNVSDGAEDAERSIRDSGSAANMAASGGINNLIGQIGRLAAGYISLRTAIGLVDDAMGNQTYGLQLQGLMGDDVGSSATAWAEQTAKQMGRVYSDVLNSTTSLTKLGFSGANIQELTDLSDRLARFTKDNDYSAMSDAIQQAFRTGRTESLSSALDLSKNALEGYGITEAIGAGDMDAFVGALERATEAAGMTQEAVEKITQGDEAQWERFKNNIISNVTEAANGFLDTFSPVFEQLNAWLESDNAQVFFAGLTTAFQVAGMVASAFVNLLIQGANWIADNWQIVMMAAAALVAYFAVKMLMAAAATAAANAPLLIMIAIAALVGYALQQMGFTAQEVMGSICGVFAVAGAAIYNTVIGVVNAIIQVLWAVLVEPAISIIEWMLNACMGGFDSFGDAVANLIGQIISWFLSLLKVVTTLIDAIFGSDWTGGLSNLQDTVLAWGKNDNAITLSREAPQLSRISYSDAWDSGYSFGESVADSVADMLSGIDLGMDDAFLNNEGTGISDLSDMSGALGNIDDNTANIAATVSNASEAELKYLKEIAERQGIDNTTSVTVNVEVTNSNQISSDADIDGFFDTFAERLEEAVLISVEGVLT